MEKGGKTKNKTLLKLSLTQYTWPPSRCIQNFKSRAKLGAEKSVTDFLLERLKKG